MGAPGAGRTVSVARALVTLVFPFVTTTAKLAPLSAVIVAGMLYDASVAPVMLTPFLVH